MYDGVFWENIERLKAFNYFHKNVSVQIFDGVLKMSLSLYVVTGVRIVAPNAI